MSILATCRHAFTHTHTHRGRCQDVTFGGLESRSWRARAEESGGGAPIRGRGGMKSPGGGQGQSSPPRNWKLCSIWSSGGAKFVAEIWEAKLVVFGGGLNSPLGVLAPKLPCPRPWHAQTHIQAWRVMCISIVIEHDKHNSRDANQINDKRPEVLIVSCAPRKQSLLSAIV